MLTESKVFEDKGLSGTKSREHPSEEVSQRCDHEENLTGTLRIVLDAKSLISRAHEVLTNDTVGLRDLEGELFIIPSKDVLPSLHHMIVTAFAQHHVPLNRYQMVEHFQTAVALTKVCAGVAFLPSSAKAFVPVGVVLRPTSCSIRPLQTFALWSRGNVDPLLQCVLNLLKEVSEELSE